MPFIDEMFRSLSEGLRNGLEQGQQAATKAAHEYFDYLRLLAADVGRWVGYGLSGHRCRVVGEEQVLCNMAAIGPCVICTAAVCLEHAFVQPGRIVCIACVSAAARKRQSAHEDRGRDFGFVEPDDDEQVSRARKRALKQLGLSEGASMAEIHEAYREMARKHHPDVQPPSKRQAAHRKMCAINDAYQFLVKGAA